MTFLVIGLSAAVTGVVIWLLVTDDPPGQRTEPRH